MKFFVVFIYAFLISFSAFCQITGKGSVLENFRAYVWENLPEPVGFTNDYEKIFSDDEIMRFNNLIKSIERETSLEIGIVTIDTLMVSKDRFFDFTLHIANTWGIGKADLDNGILFSLSQGYQIIKIDNGYGTSRLISDDETKQIINTHIIPRIRGGDYFNGIRDGIIAMAKLYKERK